MGIVYLVAFLSLGLQIRGLLGAQGLLPAASYLQQIEAYNNQLPEPGILAWNYPTVAWWSASDATLTGVCVLGALLSLGIIAGFFLLPALAAVWVLYLSLIWIGQDFLRFQWDILLVEAGFLAVWLAPTGLRSRLFADRHPPRLALWLVWWLLFRLMFESGVVKLTWDNPYPPEALPAGGNTWEDLTALLYHYWTQPLPLTGSWFAAKLPVLMQKLSVVGVLFIEIALSFLIFGPRRLRQTAAVAIGFLMVLIAATGNYNFFNLLTLVLAVVLLDDSSWPASVRLRIRGSDPPTLAARRRRRSIGLVAFGALVLVLSVPQLYHSISPSSARSLESRLGIQQFFLVNGYGLFRQMTETRPEIVIEGSSDGAEWVPFKFRFKPGDLGQRPRFTGPHQPRLDWQMWFEALNLERVHQVTGTIDPRYFSPWFATLLQRLRDGEPTVLALLEGGGPQSTSSPHIRVVLYQYRFTTSTERAATGNWWHRDLVWRESVPLS